MPDLLSEVVVSNIVAVEDHRSWREAVPRLCASMRRAKAKTA